MGDLIQREEAIFQAALELDDPDARTAFVRKASGADTALHARVASLLRAHEAAGAFLDKPQTPQKFIAAAAESAESTRKLETSAATEQPGDWIGRYRLLQKIGEGGCGVVYMAEQEEPVRRRVALKIIKVGMDTRQVIARFEAERQALAMMDHPNIARVLDAGATETGRPFFVMDLVRGIRITDYCDQAKLPTAERLELFVQVCHAIQHAHQKGIIHRDIKPSNILVTLHDGVPVPVIIDFGIAKATEQRLTDKTLFTAFEQFIGTPAYMSPEQAEMSRLDIDTRSDIYSLGVLLYELLTGRTPLDAKALLDSGLEQMRRTIREKEPVRPSTRLSTMLAADLTTVAERRRCEPLRLIHALRGDLDWVVMKCLEKDRTRRYETANGLAMDIDRHLRNEPVLARPPSSWYRVQKLARRNRAAFVAGTAIVLALVIGLTISTYSFMRERQAYRRAVLAEDNETRLRLEAEAARAAEAQERHNSELSARRSRLDSYAADVYSAFLAVQSGNLGRTLDLLERQIPRPGQEDLRGFEWRYLWQQAQGEELYSLPHEGLVSCAVFAPDGQTLASASYDGLVRIWDLTTRRVIKTIDGFEQQFGWRYLAYSPGGRWLAGIRQGKLTVWDCSQSNYPIRFELATPARVLAFTPGDGARLVAWGDGSLTVVDTSNWQHTILLTKLRPRSFPCLAIDRTGKLAALAHEGEPAVEIWNLETSSPAGFIQVKSDSELGFVSLAWSPAGLLAGATWGGSLALLDTRSETEVASVKAHAGSVFGLEFFPDGKTLVSAGHDQRIVFWSVPDLRPTAVLRGHRDEIWSLDFSKDGRQFCTASKDGTVRIWSPDRKPAPEPMGDWYAAEFSADGHYFVTLSEPTSDLALDFWDVDNAGVRTTKTLPVIGVTNLVRAVLSGDARLLAVGRRDGAVEVWNVEPAKLVRSGRVQTGVPSALALAQGNHTMAVGTDQGVLELWNVRTGQIARYPAGDSARVTSLQFTPGNHFLRVGYQGRKTERVWDLKSGAEIGRPIPAKDNSAFSADGKWLATVDTNYSVKVYELSPWRERMTIRGHRWTVDAVSFSPDGKVVATAGLDGVARLWEAATGAELTRPLRGHLQGVTGLSFSPDGKALATSSTDNTVKVWHVATGRELFSAKNASDALFSADGNTLLLGTGHAARLLHVPTLDEIDAARTAGNGDKGTAWLYPR